MLYLQKISSSSTEVSLERFKKYTRAASWVLFMSRYYSKYISGFFNPCINSVSQILLFPFYKCTKQSLERLYDLSKVTELISNRAFSDCQVHTLHTILHCPHLKIKTYSQNTLHILICPWECIQLQVTGIPIYTCSNKSRLKFFVLQNICGQLVQWMDYVRPSLQMSWSFPPVFCFMVVKWWLNLQIQHPYSSHEEWKELTLVMTCFTRKKDKISPEPLSHCLPLTFVRL